MKIVATADTHFPIYKDATYGLQDLLPGGDVLVIAGDFMYAGTEKEWYARLTAFENVKKHYEHFLLVPGNHDLFFSYYSGPCIQELKNIGVTPLTPSRPLIEISGVRFGSCPFVTNLPNWAYNADEDTIWGYLDSLGRVDVMIAHSPPRGVLDSDGKNQYGTQALRRYMAQYEPEIVICGHIHEGYGTQVVKRTHVYNVAMCNVRYQQVNPAMVIEV